MFTHVLIHKQIIKYNYNYTKDKWSRVINFWKKEQFVTHAHTFRRLFLWSERDSSFEAAGYKSGSSRILRLATVNFVAKCTISRHKPWADVTGPILVRPHRNRSSMRKSVSSCLWCASTSGRYGSVVTSSSGRPAPTDLTLLKGWKK